MKKIIYFVVAIIALSFTMIESSHLITTVDLFAIVKSPDVVVVDARSAQDYNAVHITGAVSLFHKDLYKTEGVEGEYKSLAELQTMLQNKGISPDKKVICYDEGSGKYASRLFYTLEYLGYKNLAILDGQIESWKLARKPVTATPTIGKKAEFSLTADESVMVNMDYVKKLSSNTLSILIDTRPSAEFAGTEGRFEPKGHIPGAINLCWDKVAIKGSFISKEALAKLLNENGITEDKEVVIYCNTGIFASVLYFALKHIADFQNVKIYEGGIAEWVTIKDNSVVAGQ